MHKETRKELARKLFENDFLFLQGYTESDLGELIWIGCIMPKTVYDQFQKKTIVGS